MKNIKNLIIAASVASLFVSCEEQLEVEPEQSLSTELAFANELSAKGALMGVYSLVQDYEVYGSLPQLINDFHADNVSFSGSFPTLQNIRDLQILTTNSSIQTIWRDHYKAILAANAIIENIPLIEDPSFSEELKAQYVAEAKFIRALLNFQLVNLFAHPYQVAEGQNPGIPLVLEAFTGEVTLPARSTVNQVHEQIKKDLLEAISALPENYSAANGGNARATKGAAQGLLSRLFLYREEWSEAASYAQEVITDPNYELAPDYGFFENPTSEYVFYIANSAIDNGTTGSGGWASYYNPAPLGRGDAPFSLDLLEAFDVDNDLRFVNLHQINGDKIYTLKFPDAVNNSDVSPVIRITEMYLNRAEALAHLDGVNPESIALINELRLRAGLEAYELTDFDSAEELLLAIYEERRKELAFEGHRRVDLLRTGQSLREGELADETQPGDTQTILPIPQREIDINPELVQNEGYN